MQLNRVLYQILMICPSGSVSGSSLLGGNQMMAYNVYSCGRWSCSSK